MKFTIGGWKVVVEPNPPQVGVEYHHKDRDPNDMIEYVIPQKVEGGQVTYAKMYKDPSMRVSRETVTIQEFNKWFKKGR